MPIGPTHWVAASALALTLAACKDQDTRSAAPPVAAVLEDYRMLDEAPPARLAYSEPRQGYRYAERAYGLQRTFYDVEPDYGFDYGGVEPLVWETADDWSLYAEPYDNGYRYYYYEPGEAYPYFVRDDDYGYAYGPAGVLIAVFDSGGRYVAREDFRRYAPIAGRYWARGHDLRGASRERRHEVNRQAWIQAEPRVIRTSDPWLRAAAVEPQWRAWRDRDRGGELRRFEAERARREPSARQVRLDGPEQRRGIGGWLSGHDDSRDRQNGRGATHPDRKEDRGFERRVQPDERRAEVQARHDGQFQLEARRREAAARQSQSERHGHMQAQRAQQEQGRAHQQAQAEQQRAQQRQQAEAEHRGRMEAERAQAEQQRAQGRQRAEAERGQMEARRAQQQQQQQQVRQQAEQQRQARQQAEQQQRQQQQQARAAEQRGHDAVAREHGGGPPPDRPHPGAGGRGDGKDGQEKPHGNGRKG